MSKEEVEVTPELEETVLTKEFEPKVESNHNWIQRGNALECTSCPTTHREYLPTDVVMIGLDEGKPIFKRI